MIYIVKYPKWLGFFGVLSMALFHFFLFFNKKISFYKLMGSGKNGTFDIKPDWRQWALLYVAQNEKEVAPKPITDYWSFFNCKIIKLKLKPYCGHGTWDGKCCFGQLPHQIQQQGKIAVLTRATIKMSSLRNFWTNVPFVAKKMNEAEGLIVSYGIGEIPFVKQATLSIWENETAMKNFAYRMQEHATVITKTRKENWYKEDMFTRFVVIE